jgi:hypothetical protein
MESLLLSSLLVSGVLSEWALSQVRVSRELDNLYAGVRGNDVFVVENAGRIPIYCLEFGDYRKGDRELSAFLLSLPGNSRARVRSSLLLKERGRARWDGLVVATSFPFGFARKLRLIPSPGQRIVWPQPVEQMELKSRPAISSRGDIEPVSDELVEIDPWGDASRVHWPKPKEEIWLELKAPGKEMEREISGAAAAISISRSSDTTLILISKEERKVVSGRHRALDTLALLPKQEMEIVLSEVGQNPMDAEAG